MDIVYVRGLEVKTVIGVYDWEREIKQPITVDLDMACDIAKAAKTDDHNFVLDYKIVCVRVTEFIEKSHLKLLEAMAEEIATLVRKEFKVPWVRVRVGKPAAITGAKDVGVIIERGAKPEGLAVP
ncbi:MAG TPA: dihydroneopterin aldolase [Candidatus Acidoferrum sp.]|nr:dihydroneopterin aldolase [Candidatus Acidoferrum sp.]